MSNRLRIVALLALLGAAAAVRADLAPFPFRSRGMPHYYVGGAEKLGKDFPLVVSVDDRATEARLIVPKKHLDAVAAVLPNEGSRPIRWPVVGIPIAVALTLGGLWLTGLRPRLSAGRLAVLLGVIVLGVAGVTAWANPAPPPMDYQAVVPPLTGKVTVEVVEEGESVHLILNREMLKDLAGKP